MKDFEYQKHDLLLINADKINPQGDTLYNVENITKLKDNVKITLKAYGKVTSKKSNQDAVIENIVFIRFSKGVISPNSKFMIIKR